MRQITVIYESHGKDRKAPAEEQILALGAESMFGDPDGALEDLIEELEDALPLTQQELLTQSSSANALARLIGAVEDIRGRHFEENDMLFSIDRE